MRPEFLGAQLAEKALTHKYAWLALWCCTFTSNRRPLIAVRSRLSRQGHGHQTMRSTRATHHSRLASSKESFPDEIRDSHLLKGWQRSATHANLPPYGLSFIGRGLLLDALLTPIAVVVQDFYAALNVVTHRLRRGCRALDCCFLREAGKARNTVRLSFLFTSLPAADTDRCTEQDEVHVASWCNLMTRLVETWTSWEKSHQCHVSPHHKLREDPRPGDGHTRRALLEDWAEWTTKDSDQPRLGPDWQFQRRAISTDGSNMLVSTPPVNSTPDPWLVFPFSKSTNIRPKKCLRKQTTRAAHCNKRSGKRIGITQC